MWSQVIDLCPRHFPLCLFVDHTRTYASLITPPGEGGIGIIALWGPAAVDILSESFVGSSRSAEQLPAGALAHGVIRKDGRTLDEIILARLRPPHPGLAGPYFEVNCHGGVMAVRGVLRRLEQAGARVVEPDELQRAEAGPPLSRGAICAAARRELLRAPTRLSVLMLLHQARGALSREIDRVSGLLERGESGAALRRLEALLAAAPLGRALVHPPRGALLGPPNAGKSTLFNALLEEERVVVHHQPGTTRDVVTETVSIRGVPFELMDAAGIAPPRDGVEEHAVRRARDLARRCDVALVLFDARTRKLPDSLPQINPKARRIAVANKVDLLPEEGGGRLLACDGTDLVRVSALRAQNLDGLERALVRPYREHIPSCRQGGPVPFNEETVEALEAVRAELADGSASGPARLLRELRAERTIDDGEPDADGPS